MLPLSYCYTRWVTDRQHSVLKFFEDLEPKMLAREKGLWICVKLLMLEAVAETDDDLAARAAEWAEIEAPQLRTEIRQEHRFAALAALCWLLLDARRLFVSQKNVTGLGLLDMLDEARRGLVDNPLTSPHIKDISLARAQFSVEEEAVEAVAAHSFPS